MCLISREQLPIVYLRVSTNVKNQAAATSPVRHPDPLHIQNAG